MPVLSALLADNTHAWLANLKPVIVFKVEDNKIQILVAYFILDV